MTFFAGPKAPQTHRFDRAAHTVEARDVLVLDAGSFLFHGTDIYDEEHNWIMSGVLEGREEHGMNYFALDPTLSDQFTFDYLLAFRARRPLRLLNHRGDKRHTMSRRWSKETFDGAFGKVWLDQDQSGTPCLVKDIYRRREYRKHEVVIHNTMVRGAIELVAVQPRFGRFVEHENYVISVLLLQMQLIHKFLHATQVSFCQWAAVPAQPHDAVHALGDLRMTSNLHAMCASAVDNQYVAQSYLKISWTEHSLQINQGGTVAIQTPLGTRTLDTCLYYLGDDVYNPSHAFTPSHQSSFYHNNKYYLISRDEIWLIYTIDARTGHVEVAFLHPASEFYSAHLVWDMCGDVLGVHTGADTRILQPSRVLERPFDAPGQMAVLREACKARVGLRL